MTMAGSSNGNASFSKERENAIETLIDMDPRGPSIRAAAMLVSSYVVDQQTKSNLIYGIHQILVMPTNDQLFLLY